MYELFMRAVQSCISLNLPPRVWMKTTKHGDQRLIEMGLEKVQGQIIGHATEGIFEFL